MNERWLEILLIPQCNGTSVASVCRRYDISRQSFYKYRRRLWAEGVPALQPRLTRTTTEIESLIVKRRVDNPPWGARTIHTKLVQAGVPNRRACPRFIVCCNAMASSWRCSTGRRRRGNVLNAKPPKACGRSTARWSR